MISLPPLVALIATVALVADGRNPDRPADPEPPRASIAELVPPDAGSSPTADREVSRATGVGRPAAVATDPGAGDLARPAPALDLATIPPPAALQLPAPVPNPPRVEVAVEPPEREPTIDRPPIDPHPPRGEPLPAPEVEAPGPVAEIPIGRGSDSRPKPGPSDVVPRVEPAPVPAPPRPVQTASIHVLMPTARAELVVKGEVGRGNPDEWYGPTRVIHSPPMGRAEEYIVGAFWLDEAGRPLTRSRKLRVEPGKVYEVDLRPGLPTCKEVQNANPIKESTPRKTP